MADHAQFDMALRRGRLRAGNGRLVDHAGFVVPRDRQGLEAGFLQDDQPIGPGQRLLRVRVCGNVAIEIGAGQRHHQRSFGVSGMEGRNRGKTAPRMQGKHQVGRPAIPGDGHLDPVAGGAEPFAPAACRKAVAGTGAVRCGGDQGDVHGVKSTR